MDFIRENYSLLQVILVLIIQCINIPCLFATQPFQNTDKTVQTSESQEMSSGPDLQAKVDRTHEMLSDSILNTARWMDSFFYDERYAQEENKTRLKFRLSSFLEESKDMEYKFRADLRLVLPGFEDRLALVFSGDDEEEGIGLNAKNNFDIEDLKRTNKEDTSVSLRYIIETIERRNISATLGFRWRGDLLVTVPELRWRENFEYKNWELRFVQRLRWFSDVGWEEKTSFDLDGFLYDNYLFRTTLDGTWSEKEESDNGYIYNLNFSLYHPLGPEHALIYEINNNFQTKPVDHLKKIVLKLRYRQRLWRDWIYLEIAPQLAFPDEEDFNITPGILVFIDAIVGHYDKDK
jgi:hypothetical protein